MAGEPADSFGLIDAQTAVRDPGVRQARVQEIDFRRPTKFARDVVRRLEHAHDSFCRTASSGLSAELRTSFELSVAGSEQLPYGTAMAEANQDALLVVLSVSPLDTEIALMVEMPLALRLVDRLLGGGAKFYESNATSLTDLETVIVRRALESIVEPLSATWLDLADVSFSVSSVQTSPMTFQLVPPSEPVLILVLDARIDNIVSPLSLCIPYRSVEGVIERFEHRHYGLDEVDAATADQVRAAVSKVNVDLRVEVGAVEMQVTDMLNLSVGDVIRLHRQADSGVVLYAGDTPAFIATPGRNHRRRAVQVRGPWMEGA
jgi:flagellar motor switch protein FliM